MTSAKLTAIGSGKGGTGKTLVATALASALAHAGERVLLFDADVGLSNTTVHLGLGSGGDFVGFLSDRTKLLESVVPVCGGIGTRGGFDLLAAPAGSGSFANIDAGEVENLIAKLRGERSYDRILFDLSSGVGTATMTFAARSDETLLVMNADPAALADAYAFTKIAIRLGGHIPKAVVNMAENAGEAQRTAEALAKTCRAFLKIELQHLSTVPRDPRAGGAVRLQQPLTVLYPQSPAAVAINLLARLLREPNFRARKLEVVPSRC